MQSIRQVARLNDLELEKVVPPNASWHTDYRDTAYIHIGGLPFNLSEGDVLTIFSQYGCPVDVKLARDKDTGKSRGFGWLKYEDQRSCDLAVDNLSGAGVLGRVLSVDHARYQRREREVETVGEEDEVQDGEADDTDREGDRRRKRRRSSGSESEEERPMIKEEVELAQLMREQDDEDPMKAFLIKEKKAEVEEALKSVAKKGSKDRESKNRHRHHRSRRENGKDGEGQRRSNGHKSRRDRSNDSESGRRRHHSSRPKREHSASGDSEDERDAPRRKPKREASASDDERDRRRRRGSSSE